MAKSTIKSVVVEKIVVVKQDVEKIVLELDRNEAEALFDITSCVAGCPDYSRRKYTSQVYDALGSVLMEDYETSTDRRSNDLYGQLRFSEQKSMMKTEGDEEDW